MGNVALAGEISASTGAIGGWTIDANGLINGNTKIYPGEFVIKNSGTKGIGILGPALSFFDGTTSEASIRLDTSNNFIIAGQEITLESNTSPAQILKNGVYRQLPGAQLSGTTLTIYLE